MCLGSSCVLCDSSNTLGLAEAGTHSVKFFLPPSLLSPCVFKRNVVHLILIHFRLTQQKSCLGRARKCPSGKPDLFNGSLISIFLSTPDNLTFSKQARRFRFSRPCTCTQPSIAVIPLPTSWFSVLESQWLPPLSELASLSDSKITAWSSELHLACSAKQPFIPSLHCVAVGCRTRLAKPSPTSASVLSPWP